jgi:hypothetical protein
MIPLKSPWAFSGLDPGHEMFELRYSPFVVN